MLGALLFGALTMGACKRSGGGTTPGGEGGGGGGTTPGGDPSTPTENVTVYLNLGEIGLYEGKKGTDYPEVFVENGVKLVAKPGTALPGADKVTSTSGATFVSWMVYEGSGAPRAYTTVPAYDTVLYANWTGGSGTVPTDPTNPTDPQTGDIEYTCTDLPSWITDDGCKIFAWVWSVNDAGSWKVCTYGDPATSLTFSVGEELTGFLLARCHKDTTLPDWNVKTDVAGRVYNQTENIDCTAGTHSYTCASWKEYN